MPLFEPLFLLLALTSLVTLSMALVMAATQRVDRAVRLLTRLGVGVAAYLLIVVAASLLRTPRIVSVGEPQCFDDWCIAVTQVVRTATAEGARVDVALTLSSRARRVPMGETGTVAYLIDARGRRYDVMSNASDVPFSRRLQPGASIDTSRQFLVSQDASDLAFVYTHEGGVPIGWLIIGGTGWFKGPPRVVLPTAN